MQAEQPTKAPSVSQPDGCSWLEPERGKAGPLVMELGGETENVADAMQQVLLAPPSFHAF